MTDRSDHWIPTSLENTNANAKEKDRSASTRESVERAIAAASSLGIAHMVQNVPVVSSAAAGVSSAVALSLATGVSSGASGATSPPSDTGATAACSSDMS